MPDPTDLIREADAALDGITPGQWRWTNELRQRLVTGDDDNLDREIIRCAALLHPQRPDAEFIAAGPDLVRRLRDALAASGAEVHRLRTELSAWTTATLGLVRERDEARETADRFREGLGETETALAEANATIERVQAIVDDPTLKDYAALAAVRRALAKREEP